MSHSILDDLSAHVEQKPILVLRLDGAEWYELRGSRRGISEFTTALPHDAIANLKVPTICLILARTNDFFQKEDAAPPRAYLGLVSSRSPVTTLETRIKIKRALEHLPFS